MIELRNDNLIISNMLFLTFVASSILILNIKRYRKRKIMDCKKNVTELEESKQLLNRQISLKDFIYLCIILGVVVIAIVSMSIGGSQKAEDSLNFAATTVSMVLAVIAIIITLWDVAGQRHNIDELRSAVKEMKSLVTEVRSQIDKTYIQFNEVVKEELLEKLSDLDEFKNQLHTKIAANKTISEGEDFIKAKDIEKLISNVGDIKIYAKVLNIQNFNYQKLLEYLYTNMKGYGIDVEIKQQAFSPEILSIRLRGPIDIDTIDDILANSPEDIEIYGTNKTLL